MKKSALLLVIIIVIGTAIGTLMFFKFSKKEEFNYAVYYGQYTTDLALFDLVIIPPTYNSSELLYLHSHDTLVLGYISICTIGSWEPWANNVTEDIIIGYWETWNESIINITTEKWRAIFEWAVDYILSRGYDGVFIDNLDFVDLYPWMNTSMIQLVRLAKQKGAVVAVNRGFSILEHIASSVDYVLYEGFGTIYDFSTGEYRKLNQEELAFLNEISSKLVDMKNKYDFDVLALGYANLSDPLQRSEYEEYVNNLANKYGFYPYVADITLQILNLDYT